MLLPFWVYLQRCSFVQLIKCLAQIIHRGICNPCISGSRRVAAILAPAPSITTCQPPDGVVSLILIHYSLYLFSHTYCLFQNYPITVTCRSVTLNESQRFQLINMLLNRCYRDTHFSSHVTSCNIVISIY